MRVVVATHAGPACPAALALACEGVTAEVAATPGESGYAELLTRYWAVPGGFILVEGDKVPWPGALAALKACGQPWCGHRYPRHGRIGDLYGLGCVKFSAALTAGTPRLPEAWARQSWQVLDGLVFAALAGATGRPWFHEHHPPVAHARPVP